MYENDQNSVNGELKQPKSFEQNENDEFAPAGEDSKNEFTAAESEPNGEPAGGSKYEWNHYDKTAAQPEPKQVIYKENVFMGVLGAILFAIPGGALTFALSIFGYIAAISGIATAALAMLGYRIFSGANKNKGMKSSVASIVTSVIATLLMLLLAEFFCLQLCDVKKLRINNLRKHVRNARAASGCGVSEILHHRRSRSVAVCCNRNGRIYLVPCEKGQNRLTFDGS